MKEAIRVIEENNILEKYDDFQQEILKNELEDIQNTNELEKWLNRNELKELFILTAIKDGVVSQFKKYEDIYNEVQYNGYENFSDIWEILQDTIYQLTNEFNYIGMYETQKWVEENIEYIRNNVDNFDYYIYEAWENKSKRNNLNPYMEEYEGMDKLDWAFENQDYIDEVLELESGDFSNFLNMISMVYERKVMEMVENDMNDQIEEFIDFLNNDYLHENF